MMSQVLGLDIGGANLKAALSDGTARSRPFALWKNPKELVNQLKYIVDGWSWDRVGITMTGELCDCFATKNLGVWHILTAAREVFGDNVAVWRTDEQFIDLSSAIEDPATCAASNWLALATFAGRLVPNGNGLLVDIGSTTTDIVPLRDGRPCPTGRTDMERLKTRELVYTGVRRTPLCAILGWDAMAEFYATTQDVYLTLGQLKEDANDCDTADSRPATKHWAHSRLAHMLGGDLELISPQETKQLAERVCADQVFAVSKAITHVMRQQHMETANGIVLSGAGEFLARKTIEAVRQLDGVPFSSLAEKLGGDISSAACAYAIATLLGEGHLGP